MTANIKHATRMLRHLTSAREQIGPHARPLVADVTTIRKRAATERAEARLQALADSYATQCSRVRVELAVEIKAIERGW